MPDSKPERRGKKRVSAQVPITIHGAGENREVTGLTRDLSANGVFFYTQVPFQQGSELEMVLILPEELTTGQKRWVCCQATVVRVEQAADGVKCGVAASVSSMEFLPELTG